MLPRRARSYRSLVSLSYSSSLGITAMLFSVTLTRTPCSTISSVCRASLRLARPASLWLRPGFLLFACSLRRLRDENGSALCFSHWTHLSLTKVFLSRSDRALSDVFAQAFFFLRCPKLSWSALDGSGDPQSTGAALVPFLLLLNLRGVHARASGSRLFPRAIEETVSMWRRKYFRFPRMRVSNSPFFSLLPPDLQPHVVVFPLPFFLRCLPHQIPPVLDAFLKGVR